MLVRRIAKSQGHRLRSGVWLRGQAGFVQPDRGATAAEYALMVGLIAVIIAVAITSFGESVSALFIVPAGTF